MTAMSPEDAVVEAVTQAAQATFGRLSTAHPWAAGFALVVVAGALMLGLVSGYIKPASLTTPRKRAGARIALRFGLAAKGSAADVRAFVRNEDPPDEPDHDPLAVAAASLPGAPPPTALVAQARALAPHPATVAATTPHDPGPAVPREEPQTAPPPPMRPRSRSAGDIPAPSRDLAPTSRDLPPRGRDRGRS